MNIPFKQTSSYVSTNIYSGNSGNGSKINKPTIPIIDFNPTNKFEIGRYNNNIQPTQMSTLFSNSDKLYYHTNNPINGNNWINNSGLSGRGSNRGSFYKPNNWTPYDLKDSYIYDTEPNSQNTPYNPNSLFIDGSTTRAWSSYQSNNVNNSIGGLEQITPIDEIIPQERPIERPIDEQEEQFDEKEYII